VKYPPICAASWTRPNAPSRANELEDAKKPGPSTCGLSSGLLLATTVRHGYRANRNQPRIFAPEPANCVPFVICRNGFVLIRNTFTLRWIKSEVVKSSCLNLKRRSVTLPCFACQAC